MLADGVVSEPIARLSTLDRGLFHFFRKVRSIKCCMIFYTRYGCDNHEIRFPQPIFDKSDCCPPFGEEVCCAQFGIEGAAWVGVAHRPQTSSLNVELQTELLAELILPLLDQTARGDDQAAFQITSGN